MHTSQFPKMDPYDWLQGHICVYWLIVLVKIDWMSRAYQPKRYSLCLRSAVSTAHLLAAREDLCYMVKTSSGSCREKTSCAVNRVRRLSFLAFLSGCGWRVMIGESSDPDGPGSWPRGTDFWDRSASAGDACVEEEIWWRRRTRRESRSGWMESRPMEPRRPRRTVLSLIRDLGKFIFNKSVVVCFIELFNIKSWRHHALPQKTAESNEE